MPGQSIHALHVSGAVFCVGSMGFALLAPRPALAEVKPSARLALHAGALRRFFLMVCQAMPALLLTGCALLFFCYGGFRGAGWRSHAMHATGHGDGGRLRGVVL